MKDFNEYRKLALRTLNHQGKDRNILHCILGMVGEAGELSEIIGFSKTLAPAIDRGQAIGELGDCLWYAAVLSEELNTDFEGLMFDAKHVDRGGVIHDMKTPYERLLIQSCRMADLVKKTVFYGKKLDEAKLIHMLFQYLIAFNEACSLLLVQGLVVAEINIKKLEARYPDKFDAERAINRDYDAESKAAGVQIV